MRFLLHAAFAAAVSAASIGAGLNYSWWDQTHQPGSSSQGGHVALKDDKLTAYTYSDPIDCGGTDAGKPACGCMASSTPCADISSIGKPSAQVKTQYGDVIGREYQDGMSAFFGVPVAAGMGAEGFNRFRPPMKPKPWTTPMETTHEKICPIWMYPVGGTQDCISVDIMTPSIDGVVSYPVTMWIHGGGFTSENPFFMGLTWGPMQHYNFADLPNGGKTVSVLCHYRLGALGWMVHSGFAGEDLGAFPTRAFENLGPSLKSGNWGMMDAISAIYWIHDNIGAFGGDKSKLTVYGESAGGAHVAMLMASPMLTDALGAAVVQTFIAQSPYISFGPATFSEKARAEMNKLFTYRAGCDIGDDEKEADCLRKASIINLIADYSFSGAAGGGLASSDDAKTQFNAAFGTVGGMGASLFLYNTINVWPVVDDLTLTKAPLDAYASGINLGSTFVVGHNTDEYTTFCYYPPFGLMGKWSCMDGPDPMNHGWILAMNSMTSTGAFALSTSSTWKEMLAAIGSAMDSAAYKSLPVGTGEAMSYDEYVGSDGQEKTVQMGTDAWFASGNEQAINAMLKAQKPAYTGVYHYVFAQDTDPWLEGSVMGACHGCELSYVLGFFKHPDGGETYLSSQTPASYGMVTHTQSEGAMKVGNAMNWYWANLFYYQNPNGVMSPNYPKWEAMGVGVKHTMNFNQAYEYGAAMNPCVRYASCKTESGRDWRREAKSFWQHASVQDAAECNKDLPTGSTTHIEGAAVGINCTFMTCCSKYTAARSLLFGVTTHAPMPPACDEAC